MFHCVSFSSVISLVVCGLLRLGSAMMYFLYSCVEQEAYLVVVGILLTLFPDTNSFLCLCLFVFVCPAVFCSVPLRSTTNHTRITPRGVLCFVPSYSTQCSFMQLKRPFCTSRPTVWFSLFHLMSLYPALWSKVCFSSSSASPSAWNEEGINLKQS